jgi:hypothetical protein
LATSDTLPRSSIVRTVGTIRSRSAMKPSSPAIPAGSSPPRRNTDAGIRCFDYLGD